MPKDLPSPELLRKLLRYDPETGKLFWRSRTPGMFLSKSSQSQEHRCRIWNSKYSGAEAFKGISSKGYCTGTIFSNGYLAHRVAWAIHHGAWPDDQIDHLNGVRSDNRVSNLRVVSHAENQKNKKKPKDNTSGVVGVSWNRSYMKWEAQIASDGRNRFLGYFSEKNDAVKARKAGELKYGFHRNHGRKE